MSNDKRQLRNRFCIRLTGETGIGGSAAGKERIVICGDNLDTDAPSKVSNAMERKKRRVANACSREC